MARLHSGDITKLEKAAQSPRDKLIIQLLATLGCKVSDLLNLEVKDIDFRKGVITYTHCTTYRRSLCQNCNAYLLYDSWKFCPYCGDKVREDKKVSIKNYAMVTIGIKKKTLTLLKKLVDGKASTDKVFAISRYCTWRIVKGAAKRAGLPNISLESLRHTE